jgi:AcrR family transcriptional regulator
VPRDAASTREQLLDAGQRLFAEQGAFRAPLKQVVDAAGQRNASALHYHFGGREGLLDAILARYNEPIEAERKVLLDRLHDAGSDDDVRALVTTVVVPLAGQLDTPDGRQFLSIVSQLVDLFDRWDEDEQRTPQQVLRAFRSIEAALADELSPAVRHERLTRFLGLVTEALGARARRIEANRPLALSAEAFEQNLIDMAVGALCAPGSAA